MTEPSGTAQRIAKAIVQRSTSARGGEDANPFLRAEPPKVVTSAPLPSPPTRTTPVNLKISSRFHCGCGYFTVQVRQAADHSLETGHSLTISGEVRSR